MRLKFSIVGEKVHDVGYRVMLINEALVLGLDYFNVFNTFLGEKEVVVVLIEGEEEQIVEFKRFMVQRKPERAVVDEIKEESYSGRISSIDRTMQAFQMEQWGKGIPILLDIRENTRLIPEIAENTRIMLVKQDETIREIKELRSDLKSYLDVRFAALEAEIAKIKQKIGLS